MRLTSTDGTEFRLDIDGYEFPSIAAVGTSDWDANWLVVSGTVTLPDGRTHAFTEPCLTTWEASSLQAWLRGLASAFGGVSAPGERSTLTFTEPCLSFAASALRDGEIEIRVSLSAEARPAFDVSRDHGTAPNVVPLRVDRASLRTAADDWTSQLEAFPARGS